MLLFRLCFILVVVVASASPGQAEIVTFGMEGTVNSIDDPLGFIDFAQVGDRVVYEFTIDLATPDSNSTPTFAEYYGAASQVQIANETIISGTPLVQIQPHDYFSVTSQSFFYGGIRASLYFSVWDPQNIGVPDDTLLSLPYADLSVFTLRSFQVSFYVPTDPPGPYPVHLKIVGPIDSFYVVPEPGTAVLIALGLMALTAGVGTGTELVYEQDDH